MRITAGILAGAALLLWPAALNHYPLVFSDTGALLAQTVQGWAIWDKPLVYGPLLHALHWRVTLWLPLAAILALIFKPDLSPTLAEVATFAVAIWGAYLIRTMFQSVLGLITFWTTRVGAVFELYFAAELLLSQDLDALRVYAGGEYFFRRDPADLPRRLLHGGAELRVEDL